MMIIIKASYEFVLDSKSKKPRWLHKYKITLSDLKIIVHKLSLTIYPHKGTELQQVILSYDENTGNPTRGSKESVSLT